MNDKLDRVSNLSMIWIIGMILIGSLCSCNPFVGPRQLPPIPGETAQAYSARIEEAARLVDRDPANLWNILETIAAAGGLTGLSFWIRRVKQNGYTQTADLQSRLQTTEYNVEARLRNLEQRSSMQTPQPQPQVETAGPNPRPLHR